MKFDSADKAREYLEASGLKGVQYEHPENGLTEVLFSTMSDTAVIQSANAVFALKSKEGNGSQSPAHS